MVVCRLTTCPYRAEGEICEKDLVHINEFGQCMVWFDKHGKRIPVLDANERRSRVAIQEGEIKDGSNSNAASATNN